MNAQISVRLCRRCVQGSSNFCKVQVKDNLTKHTRLLLWAPFMPLLGGIKLPCTCTFHLFAIVLKYIWQKVLLLSLACLCSRKSVCGSRDFSGGSHSGKMFLKMKVCAKNKSWLWKRPAGNQILSRHWSGFSQYGRPLVNPNPIERNSSSPPTLRHVFYPSIFGAFYVYFQPVSPARTAWF